MAWDEQRPFYSVGPHRHHYAQPPERMNALTHELGRAASDLTRRMPCDHVIILTGAGRAFCAGGDQGQPEDRHGRSIRGQLPEYIEFWHRNDGNRVIDPYGGWAPIIAAVNGWAMGGASGTSSPPTSPLRRTRRYSPSQKCATSRTPAS
jgi:1,4-dihydroxy-2-naphthoyl-CoA synthase